MRKETNHRPYILIGCLIWIAAFFGEAYGLQPYSTIGMLVSPPITIFGVICWFKFYKRTRGHYPRFVECFFERFVNLKNPLAGIAFLFKHVLEFWTFAIICWMALFLIIFLTLGQSDAFKTAKKYCENNTEIIEKTGEIKYYGLLVEGNISTNGTSGESDLSFTIVGKNGVFKVKADLIKYNEAWEVTDLIVKR